MSKLLEEKKDGYTIYTVSIEGTGKKFKVTIDKEMIQEKSKYCQPFKEDE